MNRLQCVVTLVMGSLAVPVVAESLRPEAQLSSTQSNQQQSRQQSGQFNIANTYGGAGIGFNELGESGIDDAAGFQIFAGYKFPNQLIDNIGLAFEAGYMNSGDFDYNFGPTRGSESVSGLWGTAVATVFLQERVNLISRAGLDIGDDDGVMMGLGVEFMLNHKTGLRGEYVLRDNVNSFQVNARIDF